MRIAITWLSLWICGIWFIISGFVKVVDPVAFSRKLDEYFHKVFHLPFLDAYSVGLAMFISVLEIAVGAAMVVGFRMKITAWVALLMMLYFTFLTGYSAITGAVKSCGCFGEAIKFTPKQSFIKDLVIMVFIGWIFKQRKEILPYLKNDIWVNFTVVIFTIVSGWISIYAYRNLPLIEFHEYKNGNPFPVTGIEKDISKGNYLIVILDVKKPIPQWNSLEKLALYEKANYTIIGLSGEVKADIKFFNEVRKPHFPIYSTDKDLLKTMIRSFPSCVLVKNNIIIKKWGAFHIPTPEQVNNLLQ
ncbi:MAG: DoxX family protein [Bacteroidia bacterium]|nr:DoxX family protein [Bacteroidia bacterium]MDW8347991.1 DoxX family protein [Bacteroidia bacterium]